MADISLLLILRKQFWQIFCRLILFLLEQRIATSSTVARDHPFVAQLQSVLGKTDAEIDAIFDAAK